MHADLLAKFKETQREGWSEFRAARSYHRACGAIGELRENYLIIRATKR